MTLLNERNTAIAIQAPDWFVRGSVYQINPRTFSEEGTIRAVTKELPFLAELGFTTMYLCPIFEEDDSADPINWSPRQIASGTENPKNPYRMNDYYEIDSEYGTMTDLREFVAESHRLGMRVLLDLVYFHIGPNAPVLKRHPEFARHDTQGNIELTGWKFPKLNYDHPGLREYLWCNMTYYIGEFDVDGFRCDVGDLVPLDFWIEGRRRIQSIKPDAILLNEGSNCEYLEKAFDATYSFDWHERVYSVLSGKLSVSELRKGHEALREKAPLGAAILRDMDNHDTVTDWPVRAELVAGHEGMELVEVLNYVIDGIPMVYCGNELADTADLSMFYNRFHRGRFQATDRETLKQCESGLRRQNVIKTLNAWKRSSEVLHRGNLCWLEHDSPEQVIAFSRTAGEETLLFVGNITKELCTATVDGVDLAKGEILLQSQTRISWDTGKIILPPYGYAVVKR